MKKIISITMILLAVVMLMPTNLLAQEEEKDMRTVRETFNGVLMLDQQSVMSPRDKGLELLIHHRFGKIKEIKDVYGLYAPSNIRLGLLFGVTKKLMIGWGYEKNNKLMEFQVKYAILQQTRGGTIPVSVSYYVNMASDLRNEEAFGVNYAMTNRMSYFHQVIVARKFSDRFSAQVAPTFAHFNAVDSVWHNDYFGFSAAARFKAFGEFSIIAEYDQAFTYKTVRSFQNSPKPNLAFGFEIGTSTHFFQMFIATYDKITPQKNFANNLNDFTKGEFLISMNVNVRF